MELKSPDFYAEIGLISGLEVHQQLLTDRKMFCRCPARRYTDTHDGEVLRMMRTVVSHEITGREPHNGYLIMQGGLPEIEEFILSHWK